MDRAAFLDRVRQGLAGVEAPALPETFPPTPGSGRAGPLPDLVERFVAELAGTNGLARVVRRAELADAVTGVARELGSRRATVVTGDVEPWRTDVDRGLEEARAEIVRPVADAWREEAARADLGVTSAVLGVAATGSVLLSPGKDSPRVASLLPPAHLVILPVERLVPGLEEAMPAVARLAGDCSAPVLVTGPSRTSDIEMTTVYGVHGPRVFRVLLVQ
jgi:L-lactate dehydrogenase complex protein LldG